jgi:uncharacterized protein YwgA
MRPSYSRSEESCPVSKQPPSKLIRLLELYGSCGYRTSYIEMQKLVYFLKVAGEPTLQKLEYERSHYGPYAHNLACIIHEDI